MMSHRCCQLRRYTFLVQQKGLDAAGQFMIDNVIRTYRKVVLLRRTHTMYRRQLIEAYVCAKNIMGRYGDAR